MSVEVIFTNDVEDLPLLSLVVTSVTRRERNREDDPRGWTKAPRVYVSRKCDNVLEDIIHRRSHQTSELRPLVLEALKKEGVDVSNLKVTWSQKAGCSCGCSPGFILLGVEPAQGRWDMWVEYDVQVSQAFVQLQGVRSAD